MGSGKTCTGVGVVGVIRRGGPKIPGSQTLSYSLVFAIGGPDSDP